eukprot:6756909-Prymnesium_polylepis.1
MKVALALSPENAVEAPSGRHRLRDLRPTGPPVSLRYGVLSAGALPLRGAHHFLGGRIRPWAQGAQAAGGAARAPRGCGALPLGVGHRGGMRRHPL